MVTEFLEPGGTRSDLSEVIPLLKKPESPHGCFILMYDKIHYKKKKPESLRDIAGGPMAETPMQGCRHGFDLWPGN